MGERKCLYVQFEIRKGDQPEDFYAIEDTLFQAFEQNNFAVVDGHDVGQGRFNIFIFQRALGDRSSSASWLFSN